MLDIFMTLQCLCLRQRLIWRNILEVFLMTLGGRRKRTILREWKKIELFKMCKLLDIPGLVINRHSVSSRALPSQILSSCCIPSKHSLESVGLRSCSNLKKTSLIQY